MAYRNGCIADADYQPCAAELQQEMLAHQPALLAPKETLDIDLFAERLLMMVLTGYPGAIVNDWAEQLLQAQRADGSWAMPSDEEPRYYAYHATYATSWALAEWYRRVVAYPKLRPE
jgi:hypothetical protein